VHSCTCSADDSLPLSLGVPALSASLDFKYTWRLYEIFNDQELGINNIHNHVSLQEKSVWLHW